MVIFHSYVELSEGNRYLLLIGLFWDCGQLQTTGADLVMVCPLQVRQRGSSRSFWPQKKRDSQVNFVVHSLAKLVI